jgi:HD-GYP domain-containing protein (c-di-GMP phosphodiesterase class II)
LLVAVRLADLLAGLSRLADLGYGLQAGEAVRSSALGAALARSLDLPEDDVRACLYTALLLHVGCTGFAHETSQMAGDEMTWNAAAELTNLTDPRDVLTTFLPLVMRGRRPLAQVQLAVRTVTRGRRFGLAFATASCEVGRDAARRLRLPTEVQHSIYRSHEWWNGKGAPDGLAGEDIPMPARIAQVTAAAALFHGIGGVDLVVRALRERAGGMLDPHLADHFAERAGRLLGQLDEADPRELMLAAEPPPAVTIPDPLLVDVAAVFGDITDLKSPYTHGHSAGVGALAREAGRLLRLDRADVHDLEIAGFLHDAGRVAISNAVWEKPGSLSTDEWEQVRLHPYHSERILSGSERLSAVVRIVGHHHERGDGSGYHRGTSSADLPMTCRILGVADAYQAMTQRRAHRPALATEQAEAQLTAEARRGLHDPDAVSAVLAAAGHDAVVRRELPAGLTDREVEVLELVARGCTNPQIAKRLVVSRRTAEQHVQNIYRKIGVSSRAAAALFAMEHRLLKDQ